MFCYATNHGKKGNFKGQIAKILERNFLEPRKLANTKRKMQINYHCNLFTPFFQCLQGFLGVYLGVRTCELFLCFVVIVRVRAIMLTSLFYVTGEFHRFLHRGRALS